MAEVRNVVAVRRRAPEPDEAVVDPVELLEIDLLSDLIIAASDSPVRLSAAQIDEILGLGEPPPGPLLEV